MYLLDTHALLYFLFDDPRLSPSARQLIGSAAHVYLSIASLWEIAIKKNLGKLQMDYSISELAQICRAESIELLHITPQDLDELSKLPFIHRDPFDRLLIAQARAKGLTLITKDSFIPKYDVPTIW